MKTIDYLEANRLLVDAALERFLPDAQTRPAVLHEAMHYSVLNGGKRIRPILCLAAAEAFGVSAERAIRSAVALELFHCSTLVHDDLPCMDDDALRRGLPTCHIQFGEANAVLTGDALLIQAFELLASESGALVLELARAAGSRGVIAGQVEDLAAEGVAPNAELVEFIHLHKTAVLIRAAVRMGGLLGGASNSDMEVLTLFGEKIGLAFQIEDDILDETSTNEVLGKPAGSDLEHQKLTYPAVYGLAVAREKVKQLTEEAVEALRALSTDATRLCEVAEFLMNRSS